MLMQVEATRWQDGVPKNLQNDVLNAIESGEVIFLPRLNFEVFPQETQLLTPDYLSPKSKNVSFNVQNSTLRGCVCSEEEASLMRQMMARFAQQARSLIDSFFPHYQNNLQWGKTSYRPIEALGRKTTSHRKDDTRLHVDAFASQPVQGRRLLRVFSNINPGGQPRVWHLGEPFESVAERFLPKIRQRPWISSHLLQKLGIIKGHRTPYDFIMLQLHNAMKEDIHYQETAPYQKVLFPSGSTWIVMTDKVSHAALSGQFMLEQTFYLPPSAMHAPAMSPLHILERRVGRRLI